MYVCVCNGITQKQIEDAVGVCKRQSVKDVLKTLGVGSDCGTCIEDAVKHLLEAQGLAPRQAQSQDVSHTSRK